MFCYVRIELSVLMSVCLFIYSNPEERATAAELMEHPYLCVPPDWHFTKFTGWSTIYGCQFADVFPFHSVPSFNSLFISYTRSSQNYFIIQQSLLAYLASCIPSFEYSYNCDLYVAIWYYSVVISHWQVMNSRVWVTVRNRKKGKQIWRAIFG